MQSWRRRRTGMLLSLAAFCLILVGGVLVSLSRPDTPPSVSPQLGGKGGAAFGNAAKTPTPTATKTPTPKPVIVLYGGRGNNGTTCLGTSGTPVEMVKRDFGWDPDKLEPKYRTTTTIRLCNDNWFWDSAAYLPSDEVFQTLHWPADLLLPADRNQPIAVVSIREIDQKTTQEQQQERQQPFQSTGPCDWVPNLIVARPHINICEPIKGLVKAIAQGLRDEFVQAQDHIAFLWKTPTDPFTQDTSGLLGFWQFSWNLVLAFLGAAIAWIGLRVWLGASTSWLSYASVVELAPRLIIALLAAYFSKTLFVGLIGANNTFTSAFAENTLKTLLSEQSNGTVVSLLQIVYAIMALLLLIEAAARMAVLYLLFAFAPILLFCAALRETEGVARSSVMATLLFIFLQTMQLAVLAVGGKVIGSVLTGSAGVLAVLNLLAALAILYIALMLFLSVTRLALGGLGTPLGSGVLWASTGMFGRLAKAAIKSRGTVSSRRSSPRAFPSRESAENPRGSLFSFEGIRSRFAPSSSSSSTSAGDAAKTPSSGATGTGRTFSGNPASKTSGAPADQRQGTPSSPSSPMDGGTTSAPGGRSASPVPSAGVPTGTTSPMRPPVRTDTMTQPSEPGKTTVQGPPPPGTPPRPAPSTPPARGTPPRSTRGPKPPPRSRPPSPKP
jgi:hypothetical protein